MKSKLALYLLLVISTIVTSCAPEAAVMTSTPTASQTLLASASPVLLTPTPTPTVAPTPTPPPTLQPDQAKETIQTLLQESVDCPAPCFWNVIPGQTTLEEAKQIFARLRLLLLRTNARENKEFYATVFHLDNGVEITPILTVQENVVKNLYVGLIPEPQQTGVSRAWLSYSPEILVARYGTPSQVGIAVDTGPRTFFTMAMYFDEFDLIVQYEGYGIIATDRRVCPLVDQFDIVRIWLGKNPENPPRVVISLEEATSLTTEEFAELMVGDPKDACFNLKSEAFP